MIPLFKSTIVIWSRCDPTDMELDDLACEAVEGAAYCSKLTNQLVTSPEQDPDWDGTEFFGPIGDYQCIDPECPDAATYHDHPEGK
jgi:hypothetical protein